MKHQLQQLLQTILADLGVSGVVPEVEIPENPMHGEYTTNVAMKAAKILKKNPMDIGEEIEKAISLKIQHLNISQEDQTKSAKLDQLVQLQAIDRVEVAPPGFINIFLTEASLSTSLRSVLDQKEAYGRLPSIPSDPSRPSHPSQKIMVEFAHPNTHKAFHIGHVRNITTGESVVRLLSTVGHEVIRANYQGDVGMHIAKCLYSILHNSQFKIQNSKLNTVQEKVEFLGKAYAAGSSAYDGDEEAKSVIHDLNAMIYAAAQRFGKEKGLDTGSFDYLSLVKGSKEDADVVYQLWKETRQWSLDYFETIYTRVDSRFDRYYFESECLAGVDRVKEAVKNGILKESDGAVIFDGKPFGLDTRVFVNSLGLPTYEAKELALAPLEFSEFGHIDWLIHVVGPEQSSFFQVTFQVEELLGIQKDQQYHLAYGWVGLKKGKMSSRSGNVVLGEWLLDSLKQKIRNILALNSANMSSRAKRGIPTDQKAYTKKEVDSIAEAAAVAAVKYSFLRVGTTQEIAFDLDESISFEGDSGPYLLYTYARCKSVLRKAPQASLGSLSDVSDVSLNPEEHALARAILHFPDIVAGTAENLAPSSLCTYLNRLASAFNLFYAKHQILGEPKRLALTAAVSQVLKNGLYLLGIRTVERM